MKPIVLLFVTSIVSFLSCNNPSSDKQKELKKKENTTQNTLTTQVSIKNSVEAKTDELSNVENLIGYWFVPHNATINIRFNRDGKFIFNDYNVKLEKDETLRGTYQLEKSTLTLLYDDRPKQKFKFYKGDKGDESYYIKKSGYYFVKGGNGYEN